MRFIGANNPVALLVLCTTLGAGCSSRSLGELPGQCGLQGQVVACITYTDCEERPSLVRACTLTGECSYSQAWHTDCASDDDCPASAICADGLCLSRCETHASCGEHATCDCYSGQCVLQRCQVNSCPADTMPVPGSLACVPDPLEGDCLLPGAGDDCPPGWTAVGQRACAQTGNP